MHFRLAESQFYRMCGASRGSYTVTKVVYVVNAPLITKYETFKRDLIYAGEEVKEMITFHGSHGRRFRSAICSHSSDLT